MEKKSLNEVPFLVRTFFWTYVNLIKYSGIVLYLFNGTGNFSVGAEGLKTVVDILFLQR